MNEIHGKKTYVVAIGMALLGLYFLTANAIVTYEAGSFEGPVRRVIGWVLLSNAASVATLRHGIATAADRILRDAHGN